MSGILDAGLLRTLEQFEILARRRTKSGSRGERRSRARGLSVEFADHRHYTAGDDLRYLDWNLFGRLDRLFLKLYEEERELPVRIFLDASESMTFGEPRKFDFARRVAAAVGYVSLCGFDRVAVIPFPERPEESLARSQLRSVRGRKSGVQFLESLESLEPGGAAKLNESLKRGALEARQTGMAVVLSDFLDQDGYEAGLAALVGRGFQVHAVQILSSEELAPTAHGDLRWVDCESGAAQEVTFGRYRMKAYQETVQSYVQKLREHCQSRGVTFLSVSSAAPLEQVLLRQLRETGLWD